MKQHVLVVGNPFDGMTVYGPFNNAHEASEIPDRERWQQPDWWVVDLEKIDGCATNPSTNLHPSVVALREKGEYGQNLKWDHNAWRQAVEDCSTYLGYWEWVSEQLEKHKKKVNKNKK